MTRGRGALSALANVAAAAGVLAAAIVFALSAAVAAAGALVSCAIVLVVFVALCGSDDMGEARMAAASALSLARAVAVKAAEAVAEHDGRGAAPASKQQPDRAPPAAAAASHPRDGGGGKKAAAKDADTGKDADTESVPGDTLLSRWPPLPAGSSRSDILKRIREGPTPADGPGWIYAFRLPDTEEFAAYRGLIKIGRTEQDPPEKRVRQWHDGKAEVIKIFKSPHHKVTESMVHLYLDPKHVLIRHTLRDSAVVRTERVERISRRQEERGLYRYETEWFAVDERTALDTIAAVTASVTAVYGERKRETETAAAAVSREGDV